MGNRRGTIGVTQRTLLQAWENLHGADPLQRTLGLLQAVWPQADPARWLQVSLGERDACLFLLQASLFGTGLQTQTACPACDERLESQFDVRDVCELPSQAPVPRSPFRFDDQGYRIVYRLPCSEDVQALPATADRESDPETAVAALLQRCVLEAEFEGRAIAPARLPASIVQQLDERMAEHDPLADLRLDLGCPACGHDWSATLDIGSYVWQALDDWAQNLLVQVDTLARHYAWSERDILALTPVRRRFYLDLVQA